MVSVHIDFESRSAVDLRKTGVYVYAEHPSTDLWLIRFSLGGGPIQEWRPGDRPVEFIDAGGGFTFHAWNANFERTLWRHILTPRYGWPEPKLEQWRCTMASALAMGFPAALERAAPAIGLTIEKDLQGQGLMKRMARPRKVNEDGTYVWWDEPEKIERLSEYCAQDVEVERQIHRRVKPLSQSEQKLWFLDQRINDRGLYIDADLCNAAKKIVSDAAGRLNADMVETTGGLVERCSNVPQLAAFLAKNGIEVDSLRKGNVVELLARNDLPDAVREALELRQDAAKASVKKIDSAMAGRSKDGRAKGLFFFNGATTGRWAGRRVQPQNLQRPAEGVDVDRVIGDILSGDIDLVEMFHGASLSAIGNAIRGIVTAAPGCELISADFANIEGRVLAWLAGEQWKLDAFRAYDEGTGPDLYKVAYGRSFGIDPQDVDKSERQVGKVQELALGYQGGVGAFQSMARLYGVSIKDEDADKIKVAWREAHPNVVKLWHDLEKAAIQAVADPGTTYRCGSENRIQFIKAEGCLWVCLPSGRPLCYPYPSLTEKEMQWKDGNGKPATKLTFAFRTEINRQWADSYAYGGLWAENVVQAAARDLLAEAMKRLELKGYPIVSHAHDEAVAEVPKDFGSVEDFCRTMSEQPLWATGCPIAAAGWRGIRYRKG
jgi:DNA polymerase